MALSPMMQIYLETKEQYKDCILFYRLGDFYEMFFDDAITVSKELELTLTGKDCGLEERAPMCGVPFHAAEIYINKLVSRGYKVAIGEQVEDPKLAKGLVKREVIRVVTPGTNFDPNALEEGKNNYIMCVNYVSDKFGISVSDISTGEFYLTEVKNVRELEDEINRFLPKELICNDAFYMCGVNVSDLKNRLGIMVYSPDDSYFDEKNAKETILNHFHVSNLQGLGLADNKIAMISAGALLSYLFETQKSALSNITRLTPYQTGKYMIIDTATRRNLELCETLREKQKKGSLLWVLDKTKTAMGARLLRNYIEQPLIDKDEIIKRQECIAVLNDNLMSRDELREYLNPIYDLERLVSRISYNSANPRDLVAFKNSVAMLPHIKRVLHEFSDCKDLMEICDEIDDLEDVYKIINDAIVDEPPIAIKDGGIIKSGFNEEIDRLRKAKTESKDWLAELEEEERKRTDVKTLKIKYNKVFGYCIEISNSYKNNFTVPEDYTRKQTLVNAERYITPKLKELEETVLGAEDKLFSLEYNIFTDVREQISNQIIRIQDTAKAVAKIDVFASLAYAAEKNDFVRPNINDEGIIDIKGGRHPVVEKMLEDGLFIDNDTYLNNENDRIAIITGPNMAGKSTYMRQVALIVLMAQIGSFVPASYANISVCDRIFTRVGASDDLASGQSTFMVEMTEVANILRNATKNSLLILDEIGRGTSTFDGMSIAWAVVEYISNLNLCGAKTLFATHYHELTELEGTIEGLHNYCIAVKEQGDDIVFLRKIISGGADKSYGVQVAKIAGVPDLVINRAKELIAELEKSDISAKTKQIALEQSGINVSVDSLKEAENYDPKSDVRNTQMSFLETTNDNDVMRELKTLDLSDITPIQALNTLYRLQNELNNKYI